VAGLLLVLAAGPGCLEEVSPIDATTGSEAEDARGAPADVEDRADTAATDDTASLTDGATDTVVPPDDAANEVADAEPLDADEDSHDDAVNEVTPPSPPGVFLTVAQVPSAMNGSRPTVTPDGPLDYALRVNRAHVDLDIVASGTVDWASLSLVCRSADGAELALPPIESLSETHRQVTFSSASPLPVGEIACVANLSGPLGSASSTYRFEAADLPPNLDPFPTTDVWLVQTERDLFETTTTAMPDGTYELRSTRVEGGDGFDDFDAPFFELGLMSPNAPEAAAKVRAHILRKVKAHVHAIYRLDENGQPTEAGPNIAIVFEGDPGAPDPDDYGKPGVRFSKIALTGDAAQSDQLGSTFGRALIDWNNQETEDDTVFGLGVWPAALARAILRNTLGVLLVADYRPAQGGIPFGEAPGDAQFIGLDVDPASLTGNVRARAEIYDLIVNLGGLALASILCHEVGHSLGLVPYGPPPKGLFAGVATDFVVTLAPDAHIDTEGMNVMQTGGNLNVLEAFSGDEPAFEPLSWAYLRRQLVVGPAD
jgi:hypothetical protein